MKIIKSGIFHYLVSRYLAFGIQFINSILIAKYLGVYFFGIYGFITLSLQYLTYSNIGLNYSFNVIYSTSDKEPIEYREKLISNTILSTILISLLIVIISIFVSNFNLLPKYNINQYLFIIIAITISQHFNNFYINLFRLYGKVNEINLNQLSIPLVQFLFLFIFKGKDLLSALIYGIFVANLLSLILFFVKSPVSNSFQFKLDKSIIKPLFIRGGYLLAYNLSFYAILMVARSIVGYYYTVEEFALFNFSNSFSQSIFMLLGSLSFLFYPKLLNKIANANDVKVLVSFIEKIRKYYLTLTLLIVYFSVLMLPLLFVLLPAYKSALITMQLLLLAQLIISNSFGYTTLLVQKKKEMALTIIGTFSIFIVIICSIFFHLNGLGYNYIAIAVIIGVLFYNITTVYLGNKFTKQFASFFEMIISIYNFRLFLPVILFIIFSIINMDYYLNSFVTLGLYIWLNIRDIKEMIIGGLKLLLNEKALSI